MDQREIGRLDSAALIAAAAAAGYRVSARLLEVLRAQELLPRPRRVGHHGRSPLWVSPEGTDRQLISLLGWRTVTKNPDVLRVLLWLDGFAIPPGSVRDAVVTNLRTVLNELERALATVGGADASADRDEQIHRLAAAAASKRGPRAVPRRSRVTAIERTRSIELLLRMLGLGEAVNVSTDEAATVERVLGIGPAGRTDRVGDAGPWLTGPPEALFAAVDVIALPKALQAVLDATGEELELARGIVVALVRYLPLAARMLATLVDDDNPVGLGNAQHLDREPETPMLMLPVVLSMLRAGWQTNLQEMADALAPAPQLATQAHELLETPANAVAAALANEPPETRQAVQRIIDAALDGRFQTRPTATQPSAR